MGYRCKGLCLIPECTAMTDVMHTMSRCGNVWTQQNGRGCKNCDRAFIYRPAATPPKYCPCCGCPLRKYARSLIARQRRVSRCTRL